MWFRRFGGIGLEMGRGGRDRPWGGAKYVGVGCRGCGWLFSWARGPGRSGAFGVCAGGLSWFSGVTGVRIVGGRARAVARWACT